MNIYAFDEFDRIAKVRRKSYKTIVTPRLAANAWSAPAAIKIDIDGIQRAG